MQAYLDALVLDPSHRETLRALGLLLIRRGFRTAAHTVLRRAVGCHADDAAAQAALGHLLREAGEAEPACAAYQAALRADPSLPEAHQGMSYLLDGIDDIAAARHRDAGFAERFLTAAPYRGAGTPVSVLRLVSASGGNVPTEHLLDDTTFLTHTLVAEYAPARLALPEHHLVFNAIGDAERCAHALGQAARLLAATAAPVFNPPARITPTTRAGNARRLGGLPGVVAPRIETVPRAVLAAGLPEGFVFPVLLRSPGFQTGQHFVRVETRLALASALAALPGPCLTVIEPLDARGADGFFRKYRVMIAGDALLPLHLAVSPDWKVHHFTADMRQRPVHRAEEAAFLDDMGAVLGPGTLAALTRIRVALGLDYGGIDFALDPQGRVLLFEANATMTAASPPPDPVWDYRRAAVRAVVLRMQAVLLARAQGIVISA